MKKYPSIMRKKFILFLVLLLMYLIFLGIIYLKILLTLQNRQAEMYLLEIAQIQALQAKEMIEEEDWKEKIVRENTSPNIYFNITDEFGNIIQKSSHPDVNQEVSNILDIKFNNITDKEKLKSNLKSKNKGIIPIAFSYSKVRKISAYAPIPGTNLFIFVFMAETKVHKQLNDFIFITATFIICIILSFFFFFIHTYYLKQKMNKQIEEWENKKKLLAERIKNNITKHVTEALEKQEFLLYIQPKINTITEKWNGGEALIRWEKKEKIISPSQFMHMLERFEQIARVDEYMLRRVCQFVYELENKNIKISVNQSIQLIEQPDYIEKVYQILNETKILPQQIEIEITESMFVKNKELLNEKIDKLHDLGISVALDDFGSGYSSFSMFQDLKIDVLKMDRGFLLSKRNREKSRVILESIINLCHKLNIKTIAEGVESQEDVELMKELKCDQIQGYYYGKPISMSEFKKKIQEELT